MGADPAKIPKREDWIALLTTDMSKPIQDRQFYYVVWEVDGVPIGHSNINNIVFGKSATMHLHMWQKDLRKRGMGRMLVQRSIPYYFEKFELQVLICEPYALNPAPNKTLPKVGFQFIRQYETTPGWINFHQPVNRYEMTQQAFRGVVKTGPSKL